MAEQIYFKATIRRESAESTVLCLPVRRNVASIDVHLDDVPRLLSLDHLVPLYDENNKILICQLYQPYFGELREPALTVCPRVLLKLGWTRSKINPFTLHDKEGVLVGKTLHWLDGTEVRNSHEAELYGKEQALLLRLPKSFIKLKLLKAI